MIITALNKSWHPDHFVCLKCDKPISGSTFNEREGNPICSDCFLQYFSEICASCKKPIKGKIIKALGQPWHEDHFVCGGPCAKEPITANTFAVEDNQPLCTECA